MNADFKSRIYWPHLNIVVEKKKKTVINLGSKVSASSKTLFQ